MLFWEALQTHMENVQDHTSTGVEVARTAKRLPFDNRCAAKTKSGHRCRGRVRKGSEFCPFHDPSVSPAERRANAAKGARSRRRLSRLPDGYLRKLKSGAAVSEAMDRLYREVRSGVITPEMGKVLLSILTRIAQTHFNDGGQNGKCTPSQKKMADIEPKLTQLLTYQERAAWRKAVANAPQEVLDGRPLLAKRGESIGKPQNRPEPRPRVDRESASLVLTHAS